MTRRRIACVLLATALLAGSAYSQTRTAPPEWPQWRGPNRDGISRETGLLKQWPEDGPKKVWSITGLGEGYSSITVKDGRIYTMGTADGGEAVFALDFNTGRKQIVNTTGTGAGKNGTMLGVDAETGNLLWEFSTGVAQLSCCTPVYKDGIVAASSDYGMGTAAADIAGGAARELWHVERQGSHHGGMILVGDCIHANIDSLSCIEVKTGQIRWQNGSVGKGSLVYADGMFYCLSENNKVALVEASPEGSKEKGRFLIPKSGKPSWAHPVVVRGRLFIRDQDTLTCWDVKAK
jgi:outer membrane protein assembly factor BamB